MENNYSIEWPSWEREMVAKEEVEVKQDPGHGLLHGDVDELEEGVDVEQDPGRGLLHGDVEELEDGVEVEQGQPEEMLAEEMVAEHGNQGEEMVTEEELVEEMVAKEMAAGDGNQDVMEKVVEEGNQDVVEKKAEHGVLEVVLALPVPSMVPSMCEGCIFPPVCNKCDVAGDINLFVCLGCRLPVPKVLRRCDVCANIIVTSKFWCKDCARTYGLNKAGVCFVCGRRPEDFVDDDDLVVPKTEE